MTDKKSKFYFTLLRATEFKMGTGPATDNKLQLK